MLAVEEDCLPEHVDGHLANVVACFPNIATGKSLGDRIVAFLRAGNVDARCMSTELAPHNWSIQKRVEAAREMMLAQKSLCEIALACGFSDQSHLTRQFRSVIGVTPKAWRRLRAAVELPMPSVGEQARSAQFRPTSVISD